MQFSDDKIFCASNKVMISYKGVGIRFTNKSLNPSHIKYNMTPDGEIRTNFKRYLEEIIKNEEMERILQISQEKLERLRADTSIVSLDGVLWLY